jgi:opacity protein-like surface antigen
MANVYRDLFTFGKFTPYVGAGIGIARHEMDEVYFTGNPFLTNRIEGKSNTQLAWSLMAGTAYRISDRMDLDVGYRYIDMGSVASGHRDNAGFWNPRVQVHDIDAHEFKVGLRIHFGGDRGYEPMK